MASLEGDADVILWGGALTSSLGQSVFKLSLRVCVDAIIRAKHL